MKIGNTRATAQSGATRASAPQGGGRFSLGSTAETRGAAGLSGPASLGAVDALLALQGSDDALHSPRRKAVARGEEMLDILDDIKLALLMGRVPKARLSRLRAVVEQRSGSFSDPLLADVLDQIELRARVELAKFGTYT